MSYYIEINYQGLNMNHQNHIDLKLLIDSDGSNAAKSDEDVHTWLTELVVSVSKGDRQTVTTIMRDLGITAGNAIIDAVETLAETNKTARRILLLMSPSEGGIDLSDPESHGFIDQITPSTLTAQQNADLKSVGNVMISRAENAGLPAFNIDHVSKVRL